MRRTKDVTDVKSANTTPRGPPTKKRRLPVVTDDDLRQKQMEVLNMQLQNFKEERELRGKQMKVAESQLEVCQKQIEVNRHLENVLVQIETNPGWLQHGLQPQQPSGSEIQEGPRVIVQTNEQYYHQLQASGYTGSWVPRQ